MTRALPSAPAPLLPPVPPSAPSIRLLDRYRHGIASFNDDIQGTAAVVAAGILAALRRNGEPMAAQRLVFVGAGAAGIGIARLVQAVMRAEGATEEQIRRAIVMLDSAGLLFDGRERLDEDKRPFALPGSELERLGFSGAARYELEAVVRQVAPTILVGTSGTAGTFTEAAVREMAAQTAEPVIFPLSDPTANSEATPADILRWTGGRALVATGSPFGPVRAGGETHLVGQANNVFSFPGSAWPPSWRGSAGSLTAGSWSRPPRWPGWSQPSASSRAPCPRSSLTCCRSRGPSPWRSPARLATPEWRACPPGRT